VSDQFDAEAARIETDWRLACTDWGYDRSAEIESLRLRISTALRAKAEAARRDGAERMLDAAISVCIDNGQTGLAKTIRAAVTMPPHPANASLKQDQAIANYFGVTVDEVRKVRAAAQQKDPTP
jgi:hypothetical protein